MLMFTRPIPGFGYTTNSNALTASVITSSGSGSPKRHDATQTASERVVELPQPLFARTVTLPLTQPNFTVIEAVP